MASNNLELPDSETLIEQLLLKGVDPDSVATLLSVNRNSVTLIYNRVSQYPISINDEEVSRKVQHLMGKVLDQAIYQLEWGSPDMQLMIMKAFLQPLTRAAVGEGSSEFDDMRTQLSNIMNAMRVEVSPDAAPIGTTVIDLNN